MSLNTPFFIKYPSLTPHCITENFAALKYSHNSLITTTPYSIVFTLFPIIFSNLSSLYSKEEKNQAFLFQNIHFLFLFPTVFLSLLPYHP